MQLVALHRRTDQLWLACIVDAMHGEVVLGEINPNAYDGHGLLL
jgi:hypothetical protein